MTEERFEKNEKNRKIAKWLDPNFCGSGETKGNSTWGYTCVKYSMSIHGEPGGLYDERHTVPAFYSSEKANASALDKFIEDAPIAKLEALFDYIVGRRLTGERRRAAACDSILKLIGESPKEHA